jgi:hypothetical protein
MLRSSLLLVLTLLSIKTSYSLIARRADDKEFDVVTNPHDQRCHGNENAGNSAGAPPCCQAFRNLDSFLEPYYLITHPIPTQLDTFQKISHVKIMSVPVPTYHMKQPPRISAAELQFQLILVKDMSAEGKSRIHTVEVEMDKAKDSWFPGYYWNPLVIHEEDIGYQHVGWKFTSISERDDPYQLLGNAALSHFYALMIQTKDVREQEVVTRLSGFKAPGWMAQRIVS